MNVFTDSHTAATSTTLIGRIQQDDQDAWFRFEFLYRRLVYYWCKVMNVPRSDWDDLAQIVFQTVHRYIGSFIKHSQKTSFRPWLRKITLSRIANFQKTSQIEVIFLDDDFFENLPDDPQEENIDEETEKLTIISQALELIRSEIQSQTWEAFFLTTVSGENSFAVAEKLGMTAANVRKAKSNVMRRIREEFADLLD